MSRFRSEAEERRISLFEEFGWFSRISEIVGLAAMGA
jgi:hypothetical protein